MPGHWKQLIETIVLYDRSLLIALQIRRMIKQFAKYMYVSGERSVYTRNNVRQWIENVYVLQKPWNLDVFESVLY